MRLSGKKAELLGPLPGEAHAVEEGDYALSQLRLRSSDDIFVEQVRARRGGEEGGW